MFSLPFTDSVTFSSSIFFIANIVFHSTNFQVERRSIMDNSLLAVCKELDVSETSQGKLVALGIVTFQHLKQNEASLRMSIPGATCAKLHEALCWAAIFKTRMHRDPDFVKEFTWEAMEEGFDSEESQEPTYGISKMEHIYRTVKNLLHDKKEKNVLVANLKAYLPNDAMRQEFVSYLTDQALSNMSKGLKQSCHFPLREYTKHYIGAILNLPSCDPYPNPLVLRGTPQAGKSSVKGVVIIICRLLKIPLVIVTNAVAESEDLTQKLQRFSSDSEEGSKRVLNINGPPDGTSKLNLREGGAVVVAATPKRIEKVNAMIEELQTKFVLIVDECDAMCQTPDAHNLVEIQLKDLFDMNPCLLLLISATTISVVTILVSQFKVDVEVMRIGESDQYVGIEEIKPLMLDGKEVFLEDEDKKLNRKNGVPLDEEEEEDGSLADEDEAYIEITPTPTNACTLFADDTEYPPPGDKKSKSCLPDTGPYVPYTNAKVCALYEHALFSNENAVGVLLLDITVPIVNVPGNVFDKALGVHDIYRRRGKHIVLVVFTGKGIFYRLPSERRDRMFWKCKENTVIGDVIQAIDCNKSLGLNTPVFIFGFSKMNRGISFRSDSRVPTHLVCRLGKGYSVESVLQAFGRAAFNGRKVLEENGHSQVTAVLPWHDFMTVKKYLICAEELDKRFEDGLRGKAALEMPFPDSANFPSTTRRKTAKRKDVNNMQMMTFDEPKQPLNFDKHRPEKWVRFLLLVMDKKELEWEDRVFMDMDEIYDNFTHSSGRKLDKKHVRILLNWLICNGVLEERGGTGREPKWRIKNYKLAERIQKRRFRFGGLSK
jgi:hypothetical protein